MRHALGHPVVFPEPDSALYSPKGLRREMSHIQGGTHPVHTRTKLAGRCLRRTTSIPEQQADTSDEPRAFLNTPPPSAGGSVRPAGSRGIVRNNIEGQR